MNARAAVTAPADDVLDYIEDMLAGLAQLAEQAGERKLAAGIRLLAIEAAIASSDTGD